MEDYRIALVHDWFTVNGGAEKVTKEIYGILNKGDFYSLVDFFNNKDREHILGGQKSNTSFIQKLPWAKTKYRSYLPLFPLAIEQFDLSQYDIIVSSSYSVAKGVLTNANQLHICYCHSPMRYAWDLYHQYLNEANLTSGIKSWVAKYLLHKIRIWDVVSANRVDYFIANSSYIAKRIKKIYNRDAVVIYPPVNTDDFELVEEKEDFYLTASRMVPYKKMDLIVEAFSEMPDKRLIVIGDGPEFKKIKAKTTKNIILLGYQSFEILKEHMQKACAFVFAAEEDFGIVPVEAQACGTPVIAFGKGGSLETVVDGKTGVLFYEQTTAAIKEAIYFFEKNREQFSSLKIREHSLKFSTTRFAKEMKQYITEKISAHFKYQYPPTSPKPQN